MAGRLSQLLDPSRVILQIRSDKRTAAIHEVAHLLEGHADVVAFAPFYQELLARERLDTTCLGNEIALPHARTEHVKRMVMSVGRSVGGVHFENSNETVRLLFVLGTPKSNPGDYLQVVSSLCKLLKSADTRQALLTAETPEQFVTVLRTAEEALLVPKL